MTRFQKTRLPVPSVLQGSSFFRASVDRILSDDRVQRVLHDPLRQRIALVRCIAASTGLTFTTPAVMRYGRENRQL